MRWKTNRFSGLQRHESVQTVDVARVFMMFNKKDISCNDEQFMRLAIGAARMGIEHGQTPFGACIVRNGNVIACEHNQVWSNTDITAHAEIVAIRSACLLTQSINLSGCAIYSTCEPCPMCFSAIHWAGIETIYSGASIKDAQNAGFRELTISNKTMKRKGGSNMVIIEKLLNAECCQLFQEWLRQPERKTY